MPTVDPDALGLSDEEVDEALDTPAAEVETPPPAPADTDEGTTEYAGPDWEDRYKSLQAEFTRRAQRDAEREERLAQMEAQIAQATSQPAPTPQYDEYDEGDYGQPAADPLSDPRVRAELARIDRLEQAITNRDAVDEAAEQEAEDHAFVDDQLDSYERATGHKLSERSANWIGRTALATPDPVTGRPDVEAAVAEYRQILEDEKKAWVQTKRTGGPAPASGPGAVEVPDLDDPDQLEDHIDRRLGNL